MSTNQERSPPSAHPRQAGAQAFSPAAPNGGPSEWLITWEQRIEHGGDDFPLDDPHFDPVRNDRSSGDEGKEREIDRDVDSGVEHGGGEHAVGLPHQISREKPKWKHE